ncbi:MAG TPA: threonine dehydratase [Gammaproteobacteria bacterium]
MSARPYVAREEIERAAERIRPVVPPTPCISWPQLNALAGCEVWVKHENHTPIGAFKIRGGLVYMSELREREPAVRGVVTGTRGNHGQSVALAAAKAGLAATVVVPHGNSAEKNAAMRAFGARVIEHGKDFQEALEHALLLAERDGLHFVPAFDRRLVVGVATYAWELFHEHPDLDRVYVPIGLGSGICGVAAARDALGLRTRIVGVVADSAPAYARSFAARAAAEAPVADTVADGVACRKPNDEALGVILTRVERVLAIGEDAIRRAMCSYYVATHNVAEGAGALALAAVLQERPARDERVAVILSGGNVDWPVLRAAMDSSYRLDR